MEVFFNKVPQVQTDLLKKVIDRCPYRHIMAAGKKYRYIAAGEGKETLMLLHGAMLEPYMWFFAINELAADYRIIAPSFPAPGIGAAESSLVINSILDQEGIEDVTMIGYSFGGGLAQYYAEICPEKVNKLVLSHTGVLRKEGDIERTDEMIRKLRKMPGIFLPLIRNLRNRSGKGSEWYLFRKAFFKWQFSELTMEKFIEQFEKTRHFLEEIQHWPVGVVTYKGPVIVMGTRSDRDTFYAVDQLGSMYEKARIHVFEQKGGHHMIFLFPEIYVQSLRNYL